jgi:hypothetical protein
MLGNNMRSRLINIPRLGKVGDELSKFQGKNQYVVIDWVDKVDAWICKHTI